MDRVAHLSKTKEIYFAPKRYEKTRNLSSLILADAIIYLGNDFIRSRYEELSNVDLYNVQIIAQCYFKTSEMNRNFEKGKNSFLWLGSSGLALKGLDLCLEYFSKHPELSLDICGPLEPEFAVAFQKELSLPNINHHGFIDISSSKFKEIAERCVFTIFPSFSEGQAGSVVTAMKLGLIPIVSPNSGIVLQNFGHYIQNHQIDEAVKEILQYDHKQLQEMSERTRDFAMNNHSLEKYQKDMKTHIHSILNKNER